MPNTLSKRHKSIPRRASGLVQISNALIDRVIELILVPEKSQCCIWTARLRLFDVAQFWMVRSRYSDLKEAALSGAAGLWELDRLELFVAAMRPDVLVF